jgi:PAS domain S-box-containing protein
MEQELMQHREHLEELVEERTAELANINEQFIQEIAERMRAEETLRESEGRLRSLFETMTEGVISIAPDGQIVQANPAAEDILGLERPEIEARNYVAPEWKILRPDGTPMPPEEMAGPRAMKEKRSVKDIVMGFEHPDGSIVWLNVSASPIMDETDELEGVVGTFADILRRGHPKAPACDPLQPQAECTRVDAFESRLPSDSHSIETLAIRAGIFCFEIKPLSTHPSRTSWRRVGGVDLLVVKEGRSIEPSPPFTTLRCTGCSVKAHLAFVAEHLGHSNRVHTLENAVTTGDHIATAWCSLPYATIDLPADCLQIRTAQYADIHVADQHEILTEFPFHSGQVHPRYRVYPVKADEPCLNGHGQ